MEKLTIKETLDATGGKILSSSYGNDAIIKDISTDTRSIKKGDLFVALKGARFNGHDFVLDAYRKGAKAALVSENVKPDKSFLKKGRVLINVKNTLKALGDIAAYYRDKFNVTVIGVTGSNGKTTTKNMIACLLSYRFNTIYSYASFNNFIGTPLTLFRLNKKTNVLVQEMETNILGGIRRLAGIAKPSIGVVTNIGPTHLESLGTEYNVFCEKSELIKYLSYDSVSVINRDDKFFMKLRKQSCARRVITFGIEKNADFRANNIKLAKDGIHFNVDRIKFFLPTLFYKNVYNALAAISVSKGIFDISLKQSALLLKDFKFPRLRAELIKVRKSLIINDCFNANPQSMEDALLMLSALKARFKFAVLGDMKELGPASDKFHYKTGKLCARLGLDGLIAYGAKARFIAKGAKDNGLKDTVYCKTYREAVESIAGTIRPSSILLVKGSRAMRMENIVRELLRKLRK